MKKENEFVWKDLDQKVLKIRVLSDPEFEVVTGLDVVEKRDTVRDVN